ncbi:MFS transporter [Aneurinibacillus aneurinilyticus]|uniref:Transporter, major facilitator family protein n=1 Tax=Aneurinibacillus aneurinilyticus ATCC 12856 TaxID=649747 RepID=U1WM11_ANEAE|nr:MFS transporter [Aneurinibacillus aneurinilyticus]ERI09634.1 transporter, major facilitator family protein [Aneurinibacillus aneurinilyticus ATCC 12856]MED0706999.1 MFS transporter [Aneurinibacillus aneurinilyticus]MED0725018.1 MFS transporter [Aneurinibacillus aneurinilyticus]MED0733643.1 MFS transporter [Aneurinibacillus aneurinilyticus]MED0739293.1 MFS transporter [Aneurinibacillus aneurinilyticus]
MIQVIEAGTKPFWRASLALSIASFLVFANIYFPQPLLPVFTEEFHLSPIISSLSVSLTIFTLAISLLLYGPLSDAIGRKNIMFITMLCVTILTALIAWVPGFKTLLVLRILQGFFLAGLPAIAVAYIGEEFSSKALTVAIGIYISGNTIGGLSGRLIGGFATDWIGWHGAFIIMGGISLICLIAFTWLLPRSEHFEPKQLDWKAATNNFYRHLKNRTLLYAYAIGGLLFFVFIGEYNYITYLLQGKPYNLPTSIVSMLFLTYLAGTISSTLSGRAARLIPQAWCVGIGIVLMVLGSLATLMHSLWMIGAGLLLTSFGFFFAHSAASSWVSRHATFAKASASSLYLLSYYMGGSLGSFFLGFFYKWAGWNGVILGSLLVLALTGWYAWKMHCIEHREQLREQVVARRKGQHVLHV